MSFFAARKPLKGVVKSSSTTSSTSTSTTTGKASDAASNGTSITNGNSATSIKINASNNNTPVKTTTATKLVSVTRKVTTAVVPQTLKERQALAKAKRAKEDEEQRRRAEVQQRKAQDEAVKQRKVEKGKAKASNGDSHTGGHSLSKRNRANSSSSEAATPARRSKLTVDSSDDEGSSRLGTPVFERKQPLRVPRSNVAAPKDDLDRIQVLSGEQHVRGAMADYVPCMWRGLLRRAMSTHFLTDTFFRAFRL